MLLPLDNVETQSKHNIWLWLAPALVVPFVASLIYFVVLSGTKFALIVYTLAKVFTLLCPVAFIIVSRRQQKFCWPFDWKQHGRAIPLGLLTGGIIFAITLALFVFSPLGEVVRQASGTIRAKTEDLGVINFYIPFAIFLSVFHSLLEEFYWRWFGYGQLARLWPKPWAAAVASLAFAGHHYVVLGSYFSFWIAALFDTLVGVGGALWCGHYQRQKSLAGAWASHFLVDVVILTIGYRLIFSGS